MANPSQIAANILSATAAYSAPKRVVIGNETRRTEAIAMPIKVSPVLRITLVAKTACSRWCFAFGECFRYLFCQVGPNSHMKDINQCHEESNRGVDPKQFHSKDANRDGNRNESEDNGSKF